MKKCRRCGVELSDENTYVHKRYICKKCVGEMAKRSYLRRKNTPEFRDRLKRWYEQNPEYMRKWRKRNPNYYPNYWKKRPGDYQSVLKKQREYLRQRVRKIHSDAIIILGGKCIHCGTIDKRVLQINHKNGKGTQELKKMGALAFYESIIKRERNIDDLEVRCANCNIIHAWEMREKAYLNGNT